MKVSIYADLWYYNSNFPYLLNSEIYFMFEQDRLTLEQWPLTEIDRACQRETTRYRRREPSDTRFCLEIFRRALIYDGGNPPIRVDEAAGEILTRTYTEFIKAQINRTALQASSIDDLVQQVWL